RLRTSEIPHRAHHVISTFSHGVSGPPLPDTGTTWRGRCATNNAWRLRHRSQSSNRCAAYQSPQERTQRRKAMRSITSATVQRGDVSIRSQTAPVRRVSIAVAAVVGLSVMGPGAATWAADTTTSANTTDTAVATKHLSVDLATDTGPSIGVAQGILYGLSEDA